MGLEEDPSSGSDSEGWGFDPKDDGSDSESTDDGELGELEWAKVVQEERALICSKRAGRAAIGPSTPLRGPFSAAARSGAGARFSVAFSGGGVRAAAFQAGVLWRLASTGRLKDVEYFVAVSGGAYISSAFASHVIEAGRPAPSEDLDAWYLSIVAETLCRMQENAGYLLRDVAAVRHEPREGDLNRTPRWLDPPILLAVVLVTLVIKPVTAIVMYLVPLSEVFDLMFGAAGRAALCANDADPGTIFLQWSHLDYIAYTLLGLVAATFAVFSLEVLPECRRHPARAERRVFEEMRLRMAQLSPSAARCGKLAEPPRVSEPAPTATNLFTTAWLLRQSTLAALTRLIAMLVIGLVLIVAVTDIQLFTYDMRPQARALRVEKCGQYRSTQEGRHVGYCWDLYSGMPWYNSTIIVDTSFLEDELPPSLGAEETRRRGAKLVRNFLRYVRYVVTSVNTSLMGVMLIVLCLLCGVAVLLMPFFPSLFPFIVSLLGPGVILTLVGGFLQWRIFSPVTGQRLLFFGTWSSFGHVGWYNFVTFSLLSAMVMTLFHHTIHSTMHKFYSRSLRLAYFALGRDRTWMEVRENPYCPFLVFTGTVNDYVQPGTYMGKYQKERNIHEITFSCLHTGGGALRYVKTPYAQSLATCVALAGAATDAFILGMKDKLKYRFWLEVLSLCMGDFVSFQRRKLCVARQLRKLRCFRRRCVPSAAATQFAHRLPSILVSLLFYSVMLASHTIRWSSTHADGCRLGSKLLLLAVAVFIVFFAFSFFGFLPCFKFILHSPGIRKLHQVTGYYHRAERPPSLIYVTDGGVQDCTGLLQLMHRRCERILLALAAADPKDELDVLRTTIEMAIAQKLGSFYDPDDPQHDVRVALEKYAADRKATCLRLGIRYGWFGDSAPPEHGELFIVKNRLPEGFEDVMVPPLLTEEEICSGRSWSSDGEELGGMLQSDLSGCCCDCCHGQCLNKCCTACCPTFPHVSNANQCLTPQLFNCLCRLGFDISEEAVARAAGQPASGTQTPAQQAVPS